MITISFKSRIAFLADIALVPLNIASTGQSGINDKVYSVAIRTLAGLAALLIFPITLAALAIKKWLHHSCRNEGMNKASIDPCCSQPIPVEMAKIVEIRPFEQLEEKEEKPSPFTMISVESTVSKAADIEDGNEGITPAISDEPFSIDLFCRELIPHEIVERAEESTPIIDCKITIERPNLIQKLTPSLQKDWKWLNQKLEEFAYFYNQSLFIEAIQLYIEELISQCVKEKALTTPLSRALSVNIRVIRCIVACYRNGESMDNIQMGCLSSNYLREAIADIESKQEKLKTMEKLGPKIKRMCLNRRELLQDLLRTLKIVNVLTDSREGLDLLSQPQNITVEPEEWEKFIQVGISRYQLLEKDLDVKRVVALLNHPNPSEIQFITEQCNDLTKDLVLGRKMFVDWAAGKRTRKGLNELRLMHNQGIIRLLDQLPQDSSCFALFNSQLAIPNTFKGITDAIRVNLDLVRCYGSVSPRISAEDLNEIHDLFQLRLALIHISSLVDWTILDPLFSSNDDQSPSLRLLRQYYQGGRLLIDSILQSSMTESELLDGAAKIKKVLETGNFDRDDLRSIFDCFERSSEALFELKNIIQLPTQIPADLDLGTIAHFDNQISCQFRRYFDMVMDLLMQQINLTSSTNDLFQEILEGNPDAQQPMEGAASSQSKPILGAASSYPIPTPSKKKEAKKRRGKPKGRSSKSQLKTIRTSGSLAITGSTSVPPAPISSEAAEVIDPPSFLPIEATPSIEMDEVSDTEEKLKSEIPVKQGAIKGINHIDTDQLKQCFEVVAGLKSSSAAPSSSEGRPDLKRAMDQVLDYIDVNKYASGSRKINKVIGLLQKNGYQLLRQKGSHQTWKHPRLKEPIVLSVHSGRDLVHCRTMKAIEEQILALER